MAKKIRYEQIEGLPEVLSDLEENKADKTDTIVFNDSAVNPTNNYDGLDADLIANTSRLFFTNGVNTPIATGFIDTIVYSNGGFQTVQGDGDNFYYRRKYGGTWRPWNQVASIGLINSLSIPTESQINNWNQAYDWGDFRDYGLGINSQNTGSWDLSSGVTEFIVSTDHNSPIAGSSGRVWGFKVRYNSSGYGVSMGMRNGRAIFKTRENNVDSDWLEFWHSGNFNPANFATTNEINNIYDQLSAKANDRLSNVSYDLSESEKVNIKTKIGVEKTSNYLDTDHLNNYGSGFFSGLVVDYSFFEDGRQEPDGKLYISALAEDGSYIELDRDVTEFSRHVVTQVGVSNVLVAEGIIKTSYSLTDFSNKSRDIYLVVLYDDTGATPLWKSVSSITEIRANFEGTAWLIGKLFVADNAVFFNVYPQII